MATNFPNSLDSLTNPTSTDQLNSPSHSAQHANENDAIEALQAKVGVNGSTVTTSHDYKISQLEAAITAGVSGTKLIYQDVRNQSGVSLTKGTPVRVTGSDGASGKLLVGAASNANEAGSSKTFGLVSSTINNNSNGQVVTNGLLEGVDTTGAVDGDPVWLGVEGAKIFGLANKPVAPAHLVYLGVVVRGGQQNTGSIFVSIQNGFEVEELHNVLITQIQNKDALIYDSTSQLWKNYDLTQDFVSASDVQNSLGDYIPLNTLGQASGPAELNPDGNLLIPENSIIFEGATANDYELTLQSPDVTSDITVTLPNVSGTIATTSDISTAISNLIDSAPVALDTLNELAAALGDDPNYATTITTALGNKVSKSGGDTITTSSASVKGLIVKGSASQTANLQEWQNSSGSILAYVRNDGLISNSAMLSNYLWLGGFQSGVNLGITPSVLNEKALVIKGLASQTANLTEWQNSTGAILANVDASGNIYTASTTIWAGYNRAADGAALYNFTTVAGATYAQAAITRSSGFNGNLTISQQGTGAVVVQNGSPSAIGLIVKGSASQTANLQEWQDSSGTMVARIASNGYAELKGGLGVPSNANISYALGLGGASAYLGNAMLAISTQNGASSSVGILVRGVSGQTGDLQQWQNSSGTALAKVDATGAMFTTTAAVGTDTTQVATTAFVIDQIDASTQPGSLYQTTAPTSPEIGQIWIDSDEDVTTFDSNLIRRHTFTATAGQTNFVASINFVDSYEQVYFNGLLLLRTTDYTTTGNNTIILTTAAAAGDIIEIVTITNVNSTNTYTQAEIDVLLDSSGSIAPLSISTNTTLAAGKRYFVTSASALTLTLPASPTLNDEIQILDASGNASTYNITVARNGNKINGGTGNLIIDTDGNWTTLLYTGSTYGWKVG